MKSFYAWLSFFVNNVLAASEIDEGSVTRTILFTFNEVIRH